MTALSGEARALASAADHQLAAPVAVALAHGMHASRLDGTPLAYNNADPYLPDLLIAHPDWARPALQAVAGGDPSAGVRPAQGT